MRQMLAVTMTAMVLMAGCAQKPGAEVPGDDVAAAPAGDWPAGVKEAEVYVEVLRKYVTTPSDNSFPDKTFEVVYVLDTAYADAADPQGTPGDGEPLLPQTQEHVTSTLKDMNVKFIADKESVLDQSNGCAQVKDGGILITLGTVDGDDNEVQVGINGFVACLGATWLTYVVRNETGTGWKVTGTTGSMAIA